MAWRESFGQEVGQATSNLANAVDDRINALYQRLGYRPVQDRIVLSFAS